MRRIAIFARWPMPGLVKTRLSPALPQPVACDLYRAMIRDAMAVAAEARCEERYVFWADAPADRDEFAIPKGFRIADQSGADLGQRLVAAFDYLLRGPDDRAVVIGADCPSLDGEIVGEAFAALEKVDLALTPARDGGYCLVALRRGPARIFDQIAWGTERVLEQTIERAKAAGMSLHLTPTLDDLDSPADLVRWVSRVVVTPPASARHTMEALRAIGLLPER